MLYVVLLVLVYMGHFYTYSTLILVVDYDIHHCLFNIDICDMASDIQ